MFRDTAIRTGLLGCVCFIACTVVNGQTNHVSIFTDEQQFYRALNDLPEPNQISTSFTLSGAHVDNALGAERDEVADLTAIYCKKATAIDTMEKSISELLTGMHFQILGDWDPEFGTLRASLTARNLINSIPPEFQRIKLKVQIAQASLSQQAFSMDYVISSSPQMSSRSWNDVSTTTEAQDYIDELKGKIRARIEPVLKNNCEKAMVHESPSQEHALHALATKFNLKPNDVDAIRALLGAQNEQ